MAKGTIVRIITPGHVGVRPLGECFIVAEPDPETAVALIKQVKSATPDETLEAVGEISAAVIEQLGLRPGHWTQ